MHWSKWAPYSTCALGLWMTFSASTLARCQDAVGGSRQDTGLNLRVETTLVLIPVAVTDSLNRFVLGLQKNDFHLLEDSVEQNVAHFSGEDAPLSVGLVFDESGSMDYKLRHLPLRRRSAQFLKTMNPPMTRRFSWSSAIARNLLWGSRLTPTRFKTRLRKLSRAA